MFCCVCRCATVGYDDWSWIIKSTHQHKGDKYIWICSKYWLWNECDSLQRVNCLEPNWGMMHVYYRVGWCSRCLYLLVSLRVLVFVQSHRESSAVDHLYLIVVALWIHLVTPGRPLTLQQTLVSEQTTLKNQKSHEIS